MEDSDDSDADSDSSFVIEVSLEPEGSNIDDLDFELQNSSPLALKGGLLVKGCQKTKQGKKKGFFKSGGFLEKLGSAGDAENDEDESFGSSQKYIPCESILKWRRHVNGLMDQMEELMSKFESSESRIAYRLKKYKKFKELNEKKLFWHCKRDNLEKVRYYIEELGMSIHTKDKDKFSLLQLAVNFDSLDVTQYLLGKGIQIDEKNSYGYTALHIAVMQDRIEMMEILLAYGADCTIKSDNNMSVTEMTKNKKIRRIIREWQKLKKRRKKVPKKLLIPSPVKPVGLGSTFSGDTSSEEEEEEEGEGENEEVVVEVVESEDPGVGEDGESESDSDEDDEVPLILDGPASVQSEKGPKQLQGDEDEEEEEASAPSIPEDVAPPPPRTKKQKLVHNKVATHKRLSTMDLHSRIELLEMQLRETRRMMTKQEQAEEIYKTRIRELEDSLECQKALERIDLIEQRSPMTPTSSTSSSSFSTCSTVKTAASSIQSVSDSPPLGRGRKTKKGGEVMEEEKEKEEEGRSVLRELLSACDMDDVMENFVSERVMDVDLVLFLEKNEFYENLLTTIFRQDALRRHRFLAKLKLHFDSVAKPGQQVPNKSTKAHAWEIDRRNIVVDKVINSGAYGVVREGELRLGAGFVPVAIKELKFDGDIIKKTEIFHEIEIMCELRNKYILQCYGAYLEGNVAHIVLEYCRNDLYSFKKKIKTDYARVKYLVQIAQGMKYLHSKSILHRDLKTQNILISPEYLVKICDFGTAKHVSSLNYSFCGTVEYLAPEMCAVDQPQSDPKLRPYNSLKKEKGNNMFLMLNQIQSNNLRPPTEESTLGAIPEELKELMVQCWNKNPSKRPNSFADIIKRLKKIKKNLKKKRK